MVNFGKIVSSTGHAIGEVSSHTGNKIAKVGKKAGFLGTLGIGLGAGLGAGMFKWVGENGNTVLVVGAGVALFMLRRR
jgi:hypothetical protein